MYRILSSHAAKNFEVVRSRRILFLQYLIIVKKLYIVTILIDLNRVKLPWVTLKGLNYKSIKYKINFATVKL